MPTPKKPAKTYDHRATADLWKAVRNNDPKAVTAAINRGGNLNARAPRAGLYKKTPLDLAVELSAPEALRALLAAGARLTTRQAMYGGDYTSFHLACAVCDVECVKVFVEHRSRYGAWTQEKNTRFSAALAVLNLGFHTSLVCNAEPQIQARWNRLRLAPPIGSPRLDCQYECLSVLCHRPGRWSPEAGALALAVACLYRDDSLVCLLKRSGLDPHRPMALVQSLAFATQTTLFNDALTDAYRMSANDHDKALHLEQVDRLAGFLIDHGLTWDNTNTDDTDPWFSSISTAATDKFTQLGKSRFSAQLLTRSMGAGSERLPARRTPRL